MAWSVGLLLTDPVTSSNATTRLTVNYSNRRVKRRREVGAIDKNILERQDRCLGGCAKISATKSDLDGMDGYCWEFSQPHLPTCRVVFFGKTHTHRTHLMQQSSNPSTPTRDKECNPRVNLNKMSTLLCPEMVQQLECVDGLKFCGKNYSTSPPSEADRCHPGRPSMGRGMG